MDKKSIGWFLLVTFGLTWGVEGIMLARGVSFERVPPFFLQYVLAGLMWAPTLGAVFTRKVILRESLRVPEARLRLGSLRPYGVVMILMPILFALVYGFTVLLGLGQLDLSLKTFLAQVSAVTGSQPQPPLPASAWTILIFFTSVLVAPFLNSVFAFGEEYGWRGFLLPKLLPLGRGPAHFIGGVVWGLWHAPIVLMGFNYPGYPWVGVVWMCGLTTLLGVFESEWTLRYDSVLLASFIHGAFNSQAYGIWRVIIPNAHPLLGGFGGLIGLAGLAVLAAWAWRNRISLPPANVMGIGVACLVLVTATAAWPAEYFVDQKHAQANDQNPGTEAQPFKTIQAAVNGAQPGDTVWVKEGHYEEPVRIRNSGNRNAPITLSAWQDDRVQVGWTPRSLPVGGPWQAIEGTKCYQVRLNEDVPDDFLLVVDGKGIVTLMQDGPPPEEKVHWAAYRKADRTLTFHTDGQDPAMLGLLEYGRRPSFYSFFFIEPPASWWIIKHLEFSWQGTGLYVSGDNCVVEDCFFTHCYRAGLFLHGRTNVVRRCNFYRCGSGMGGSGPGVGHLIEDNLIVECSHTADEDILIVDIPDATVEFAGPTVFKGNMLAQVFMHNILSDNPYAGWYADCAGSQSSRVIGNAFWDNPGGGMYNEALVNDTVCQGNVFYRNGLTSSVCTRLNTIENLFYESGVGWHNMEFYPLREGYHLLRNNAFVNPGYGYLSDFGTAWGQTAYPEAFRRSMVDYNRVWLRSDAVLIDDGGTGRKYKTLDEIRQEFGWELHGEVKPYAQETVEAVAQAMGGSVVTFRIPWGKHTGEARPMLSNADLEGRWPAAPISVDANAAPSFFWRVADGHYDATPLWPAWDPNFAYHEFWQPYCSIGAPGERCGSRWYVDAEAKFPADILEKMPTRKDVLDTFGWRSAYSIGNHWLVIEGLNPDQMLPQGVGYWSPYLGAAPGAKITVSLKMRGKGIVAGEKGSPVVWLQFTNETGQQRRRAFVVGWDDEGVLHHPELTQGDYDWTEVQETVTAPAEAVRMALFFGLLPCQGEVDFDDIHLRTADAETTGGP